MLLGLIDMEPCVGMGSFGRSLFAFVKLFKCDLLSCFSVVGYIEYECYLVDPASSHMLVSKIKPCMCKYEQIQTVKLRMAH